MPRQGRIDGPGAVHHVVVRGIERKGIFKDDKDREDFIERLSDLLQEKPTPCYAWALMTNHVHLLLRTGEVPIASIMRRLLTGYAVRFNRRHHRHGHLFQNRYKSILCEEDAYLTQLVAYIHLNPFRAGTVGDVSALRSYPYCGYSALMGEMIRPWQDTQYILALFGRSVSEARKNLHRHVAKWATKGRCSDLTGGGLIRSAGGWRPVREAYRDGIRLSSDERILGSSGFVEETLKRAGEAYDRQMRLRSAGVDLSIVIKAVCRDLEVDEKELTGASKRLKVAHARALVSHIATRGLSISGSEVARRLKVDRSAVCRAAQRVENGAELAATASRILSSLGQFITIETTSP
jgi:REP element-mobilizing transposase RayT